MGYPADSRTKQLGRWLAVSLLISVCLGGFGYLFYQNDWLQTEDRDRPNGYPSVPAQVADKPKAALPVVYHFYSPECPCSRFVRDEVIALSRAYMGKVKFIAVSAEPGGEGFPFETIVDTSESIARQLGVFCTPQAVFTAEDGRILYAGAYNRARFCADDGSAYVKNALHDYLTRRRVTMVKGPIFGCLLPKVESASD